jgi:hypothetical protein
MAAVDGQVIYYEGQITATVTPVGIAFSAWVANFRPDDPIWRFIAAASNCAFDVLNGALEGPYSEHLATAYARGAIVGAAGFDASRPYGLSPLFPPSMVRSR